MTNRQSTSGTIYWLFYGDGKWAFNTVDFNSRKDWVEVSGVCIGEALNQKHQYCINMDRYYFPIWDIMSSQAGRLYTTHYGRMDAFFGFWNRMKEDGSKCQSRRSS